MGIYVEEKGKRYCNACQKEVETIERELTEKQLKDGFQVLPIIIEEMNAIAEELGV